MMPKKLLISLPCNIRELKAKVDSFDSCDVVMCQYDGDGDSLYVIPVAEEQEKSDPVKAANEFVQKLEAAYEASKGSQMVFK